MSELQTETARLLRMHVLKAALTQLPAFSELMELTSISENAILKAELSTYYATQ